MTFMDKAGNVYTDDNMPVSQSIKESLQRCGRLFDHDGKGILSRVDEKANLVFVCTTNRPFLVAKIDTEELELFRQRGRVYAKGGIFQDVGAEKVGVHTAAGFFYVPRKLLV